MSAELKKIYKKRNKELGRSDKDRAGDGNAGLATNFMDIADVKVKNGGVIAFIVPSTLVAGSAWEKMRDILDRRYRDIVIVSIAGSTDQETSFSADTDMAEVLIVATRRDDNSGGGTPVSYYNLHRCPRTILEAFGFAKAIKNTPATEDGKMLHLGTEDKGDQAIGHCILNREGFKVPYGTPGGAICVKDIDISRMAVRLSQGCFHIPLLRDDLDLPVVRLETLGTRSPAARNYDGGTKQRGGLCRGPFKPLGDKNNRIKKKENKSRQLKPGEDFPCYWPFLWNHDADLERKMVVDPDWDGIVRTTNYEGHRKKAVELWSSYATRLCFSSGFRFNSQSLSACRPPRKVLGGRCWPGFKCNEERYEIPIVLWMNTTLGLISYWCQGVRSHVGRAGFSVEVLPPFPILDVTSLSKKRLGIAEDIFKAFEDREFLPANEAWRDETRHALDREVLAQVVGLSADTLKPDGPIDLLRRKWCAEPSVHGNQPTRPPGS